jgi:protein involved in sex pheromone biosynthesis
MTWNYDDLIQSYLTKFIQLSGFTTYPDTKTRRLKSFAIDYQKNNNLSSISHYIIDIGYNYHSHTTSCFKETKNDTKKRIRKLDDNECRFRYPQKKG